MLKVFIIFVCWRVRWDYA